MQKHILTMLGLTLAGAVFAGEFTADFGKLKNSEKNHLGAGAVTDGWNTRQGSSFRLDTRDGKTAVLDNGGKSTGPGGWKIISKKHGLPLGTTVSLEFPMLVDGRYSYGEIYLSDANRNGYGLRCMRTGVKLVKYSDGTKNYRHTPDCKGEFSPVTPLPAVKERNYSLKLEQNAPGQPVTLTAVATDSTGKPVTVKLADSGFSKLPPIDLSKLDHVSLTFETQSQESPAFMLKSLKISTPDK